MRTAHDKQNRPSITSLIAFMMTVVGGYILFPGLLVPQGNAGYFDEENTLTTLIGVVYWPLQWCYDNFGWVESFYDAYFEILGAD